MEDEMLQVNALKPIEQPKEVKRWKYKKHSRHQFFFQFSRLIQ